MALTGSYTDDGLSGSSVAVQWTQASGPNGAVIANAAATNTTVSFTQSGVYGFQLAASDGMASGTAQVFVTVDQGPAVAIAAPAIINWPSNQVTLTGTVIDDGLPAGGALTSVWSAVSGPGNVVFSPATQTNTLTGSSVTNQAVTTATFGQSGTYVLSLTANDTLAGNSATATVTVNQAPVVSAGAAQMANLGAMVTLAGVVTDDGLPYGTLNRRWTEVRGPGTATFANASLTNTTVTFDQAGVYTLRLTADDGYATNSATSLVSVFAPLQPYTVDNNTLVLFHFDEASGAVTTNLGSLGGNAYCVTNSAASTPAADEHDPGGNGLFHELWHGRPVCCRQIDRLRLQQKRRIQCGCQFLVIECRRHAHERAEHGQRRADPLDAGGHDLSDGDQRQPGNHNHGLLRR